VASHVLVIVVHSVPVVRLPLVLSPEATIVIVVLVLVLSVALNTSFLVAVVSFALVVILLALIVVLLGLVVIFLSLVVIFLALVVVLALAIVASLALRLTLWFVLPTDDFSVVTRFLCTRSWICLEGSEYVS
jgi:hypothetical protein